MSIRESVLGTAITWILTTWCAWFTTDLIWRADNVTSRQWQYLMSVPGHQWSWAALFGCSTLLLVAGLLTRLYRLRALGLALAGSGCGLIVGFYLAAPFVDPGLTTLGYHPWMLGTAVLLFFAIVNWQPSPWV